MPKLIRKRTSTARNITSKIRKTVPPATILIDYNLHFKNLSLGIGVLVCFIFHHISHQLCRQIYALTERRNMKIRTTKLTYDWSIAASAASVVIHEISPIKTILLEWLVQTSMIYDFLKKTQQCHRYARQKHALWFYWCNTTTVWSSK